MAYIAPTSRTTGELVTAVIWNQDIVADVIAIYAGAMQIASQATNDLIYAASSTQLGRIAAAANAVLVTNGSSVPSLSTTLPAVNGSAVTNLNASALASGTVPSAVVSGSYTGITGVGALAAGSLAAGFTTVAVAQGGTGATSFTADRILLGNGSSAITTSANLNFANRKLFVKSDGTTSLVAEFMESAGVHSIYVRPNASSVNLISSNFQSGGVYLPIALSARETSSDFCISTAGVVSLGSTAPTSEFGLGVLYLHSAAGFSTQTFSSARTDGAAVRIGTLEWEYQTNNSTYRNVAELSVLTQASGTANKRGAYMDFRLQPDNTAGTVSVLQLSGDKSATFTGDLSALSLASSAERGITAGGGSFGTGPHTGAVIQARSNSSGSGAPGVLWLDDKAASVWAIWVDSTGVVRVGSVSGGVNPTEALGDTVGTIVGSQSTRDSKEPLSGHWQTSLTRTSPREALAAMVTAPVFDYYKKNRAYSGTLFTNTTIDDAPWIGMDPDDKHPHGRSFNPETFAGYTMLAFRSVDQRIAQLESELSRLKSERTH